MKYYFIAGEASGDLHGANLIRALRAQDPKATVRAWGGDLMEEAGAMVVKHYRDLAFMGFIEVVMNLRTILKNLASCKQDVQHFQPDALVLIDYPGFNLRMAEWAHGQGIKVYYYISPQIWAWKQSRVHQIKRTVDHMFVILPFEKEFYARFGMDVEFVGHPLLDALSRYEEQKTAFESFAQENGLDADLPIITLLPGSRQQEVRKMLPIMLSVVDDFPQYQFVIAGAPSLSESVYEPFMENARVHLVFNATYLILQQATAALVTSGTATLETALFNVPEVVCYKGSPVSYLIARKLVKIPYISLVNLVMERELVKELIQDQLTHEGLVTELQRLLPGESHRLQVLEGYAELRERLGGAGASEKTAASLLKTLRESR